MRLAAEFVPATDEVWRLQTGTDPECRLFQAMAGTGHYREPGGTRQGIYVCTPGARLLASVNSLEPDDVCQTMERGLAAYRALSQADRRLPPEVRANAERRWEQGPPTGGLVLESINRDLAGTTLPPVDRIDRWNRDHAWFSRAEARAWLPPDPVPGASQRLPDALTERLARFHLVDNVRGQTVPFARADVAGSRIDVRVRSREGSRIELEITGETRAASGAGWDMEGSIWKAEPDHPRGVATRLAGHATFDLDRGEFAAFDLVALGERRGYSENNARGAGSEPGLIGFAFRLAPPGPAQSIAPAFVDVYDAAWLGRP